MNAKGRTLEVGLGAVLTINTVCFSFLRSNMGFLHQNVGYDRMLMLGESVTGEPPVTLFRERRLAA